MSPTVSIVIPCYNKRAYVAAAIESALSQTADCEVIVIDDGSTDGSLEEIRRFDGRIRWETGPNRGGSAARNRGLSLARGGFIQFLDADDILPADKVALQLARLEGAGEHAMAFCPWSLLHDDGRIDPPDPRRYWGDHADGLSLLIEMWTWGGFFPPHAWLAPIRLIEEAGHWDETLTGDDDGEFFGRLLVRAGRLLFTDDTYVLYRDPPIGSVSSDRSLASARSFWASFLSVATRLRAMRDDRTAKRACLSRARKTAYAWCGEDEIVGAAAVYERELGLLDFSPALPLGVRWLVAIWGIRRGLALRHLIKS